MSSDPSALPSPATPPLATDVAQYLAVSQEIGNYLLQTVDRVCAQLDVRYYVYSGTLLGATRSQGWIPWDDDVDIVMFRQDFEKFRTECLALLPTDVMYSDSRSDPSHVDSIPRLLFLPSRRDQFGRRFDVTPPTKLHVGLDIFILDGAPRSELSHGIWLRAIRVLEKIIVARSTRFRDSMTYAGVRPARRAAESMAVVGSRLGSQRTWRRLHHAVSTLWSPTPRSGLYSGSNHFKKGLRKLRLSREDFEPASRINFSDLEVSAPRRTDHILSQFYGDTFMEPPPASDRVPLHLRSGLTATINGRAWRFGPRPDAGSALTSGDH